MFFLGPCSCLATPGKVREGKGRVSLAVSLALSQADFASLPGRPSRTEREEREVRTRRRVAEKL